MKYEESPSTELKRELVSDICEEIISFLNTNGGTIFIGVENNGSVLGISENDKDLVDVALSNKIYDNIFPSAVSFITHDYNEDNVLVINVSSGKNKPYYIKGKGPRPEGVYIREGRSKRQASPSEIIEMIKSSDDYSFETEVAKNQELTFAEFELVCRKNNIEFGEREKHKFSFIRDDKYTNLAFLLSDQNEASTKIGYFDDNNNFKFKREYTGSLLSIIDAVLTQAELFNNVSAKIIPGKAQREEIVSYPGSSLREAVLNAFCHADYSLPSNITLKFSDKNVVITSPGSLYKITLEEVLSGGQTYRNPNLIKVLDKLGYIENFGRGIERILSA